MSVFPNIPAPHNEPVLSYAPGTPERADLTAVLARMSAEQADLPCVVAGREVRSSTTRDVVAPHNLRHVLAKVHEADEATIASAISSAVEAQREWARWSFSDRAAVFLKAAELLAGPWRQTVNAATMLGQSKTSHQAEIDSACEMIDFLRFNVYFAERLLEAQPASGPGVWNRMDYRPLEGFVYAITPFNFTSISGNLPTAPAILGNVVFWKPARTATLSNYYLFKILEEAGLPPGVINFVSGNSGAITKQVLAHRHLAGIHFTGSTGVFRMLWRTVSEHLSDYASYPRLVGETGGKDFIVAHASADVDALAVAMVRGAYEYQGQKCSAASRAYIPKSIWPAVRERVTDMIADIRMGDVADFRTFMGAVIDRKAFTSITKYIAAAKQDPKVEVVAGGGSDDSEGYFIQPTLLRVDDPANVAMCEEMFGPVLTVYVYPDAAWADTLALTDRTSPYALTGAVFAQDRGAVLEASRALRFAAGNFYVNDKPTGAVVGQQPFGGGRASGTNDKAGSTFNLLRWISPQTIKETFDPPTDYRYPYMESD
jgi:1-pyrroline-5-carboxylate dehydrogenase